MKRLLLLVLLLSGCSGLRDHVFVNTETVLGLQVAQNQTTGLYEGRLGYARHELALVPTNNIDVLTEMQFKNLLSFTGGPSFYQRMAIGKNACESSLFLFMKNPDGTVHTQALATVNTLLQLRTGTK